MIYLRLFFEFFNVYALIIYAEKQIVNSESAYLSNNIINIL